MIYRLKFGPQPDETSGQAEAHPYVWFLEGKPMLCVEETQKLLDLPDAQEGNYLGLQIRTESPKRNGRGWTKVDASNPWGRISVGRNKKVELSFRAWELLKTLPQVFYVRGHIERDPQPPLLYSTCRYCNGKATGMCCAQAVNS